MKGAVMLRHVCIIFLLVVFLGGCGDTYREQLAKNYQRLVLESTDAGEVERVCKDVVRAEFGKLRPGKIAHSYVSSPVPFSDKRSSKSGKSVCYLTYIPYETHTEVFVQVSRHIAQAGQYRDMYSSGFKGNSHELATPMESGDNLPASKRVVWMNIGRDRVRENRILTEIQNRIKVSK